MRLRRAGPDDDPGIRALLAVSYTANVKAEAAFTRWQYWDNPFGDTRSWVWEDGGRIVCHWAAVPIPLLLDGRRVVGAKGVDIATHPDYRGRGLFTALARRLASDCAESGVAAVLSHPNPRSAGALRRAGASLVGRVPVYVLPVDDAWLAARLRLPRAAAALTRRVLFPVRRGDAAVECGDPPAGVDDLWRQVSASVGCGVVRDQAWWAWRYAARPRRPYRCFAVRRGGRLCGAAMTTTSDAFGATFVLVCELLATDEAAARGLVGACAGAGGDAVGLALAALPRTRLALLAARAGLRRLPRALEPRPLRFMVLAPGARSQALARRPWSFFWGDLDHL